MTIQPFRFLVKDAVLQTTETLNCTFKPFPPEQNAGLCKNNLVFASTTSAKALALIYISIWAGLLA